jgi:hypothetical protein
VGASIIALASLLGRKLATPGDFLEAGRPDGVQQTLEFQRLLQSAARIDLDLLIYGDVSRFRQKRPVREWFDIGAVLADEGEDKRGMSYADDDEEDGFQGIILTRSETVFIVNGRFANSVRPNNPYLGEHSYEPGSRSPRAGRCQRQFSYLGDILPFVDGSGIVAEGSKSFDRSFRFDVKPGHLSPERVQGGIQ